MNTKKLTDYTGKALCECSVSELYNALLLMTQEAAENKGYHSGKKKLYYISAEFLIGKLLSNNLINLGLYDEVKKELAEAGIDIAELEECEYEPSLGNGGLGRLAACFIDSCATLGLPANGVGLAYHCGLFRQVFAGNKQEEKPDEWLKWGKESWMRKTDTRYEIALGDFTVTSVMYEIADLVGKDNIFTFGLSSDEVIKHYAKADYVAKKYYEKDPALKEAVDFLIGKEMLAVGDKVNLNRLYKELVGKDWFMTFPDFKDYCKVKGEALKAYEDEKSWRKMTLVNIANAGFFSSDRTIKQYNDDIWHL